MEDILALLIPVLALSIPIIAIWSKHQQKMAELGGKAAPAQDGKLLARQDDKIAQLEDRVRVLERIVTDGGYSVAAEIEALRGTETGSGVPLAMPAKERV